MACSSNAIQVRTAAVGLGGGFRGLVEIAASGMFAGVLRFMKAGGSLHYSRHDTTCHATLRRCKGRDVGLA